MTTPNGHAPTGTIEPAVAATDSIPLTNQQRALLAPYVQAARQAQADLARAWTLLVVGAGVDLSTHAAELADDGTRYVVRPLVVED